MGTETSFTPNSNKVEAMKTITLFCKALLVFITPRNHFFSFLNV